MLREYKDGLRKAILRNSVLLGCLLQDSRIVRIALAAVSDASAVALHA